MKIRQICQRHMRDLYCHHGILSSQVTPTESMQDAMKALPLNERRAFMAWLNRQGPFWDEVQQHDGDDWYECNDEIVTQTAIGEAAHCILNGIDRRLVSVEPSKFVYNPVTVKRVFGNNSFEQINVPNYWNSESVETCLAAAPPALSSWNALDKLSRSRFVDLSFAQNAFKPLQYQPFMQGAANRILALLHVLNNFRQCFDEHGSRTKLGNELYAQYFTGEKSWFSDSSDTEKSQFRRNLTFDHPHVQGESLYCTWHGKVKSPQYRVHFTWPVTATNPLFIVYVGPKITKQ